MWYLRGAGQPPPEPGVSQGRVGRHPGRGIPLQTPADEVQEQRVVAPLQRSLQLPGAGRPARLASPRPPAVQHCRPVRQRRRRAVPRVAWRGNNSIIFPFYKIIFYLPFEDMKFFARFDWSSNFCGGIPKSSIIHDNWSPEMKLDENIFVWRTQNIFLPSSSPGNRG